VKIKSSKCANGTCVEVDLVSNTNKVIVYDMFGNRCIYTHDEWRAFVDGVKLNEFDI
jgi:Domain of unknown function (DUF397)